MADVTTTLVPAGTWRIDGDGSQLELAIRHLGVATVRATLTGLSGALVQQEAGTATAEVAAQVATIDSGDGRRDGFLVSPQFLDAERHPRASFAWEGTPAAVRGGWQVTGALTIAGATRPLTVRVRRLDEADATVRLAVAAELDRHELGLRFPQAAGAGDAVVGKTVKLTGTLALRR